MQGADGVMGFKGQIMGVQEFKGAKGQTLGGGNGVIGIVLQFEKLW